MTLSFSIPLEKDYSQLAIELCNRTAGIGADGLIVLIPDTSCDFKWLFYNSDGSVASMCGNGTRACAHYAYSNHLVPNSQMTFLTEQGQLLRSFWFSCANPINGA